MADIRVTREAIAMTAAGMRAHLAERGVAVSQEQMERRCASAQRREDQIREDRRSRGRE